MTNIAELRETAELLEALEVKRVKLNRAIAATRYKIGRQLERERKHRRITLHQVSGVSETGASTIYRVESGACRISNSRILEIVRAFDWIITQEPKPTTTQTP
jgi:hypothetical protein